RLLAGGYGGFMDVTSGEKVYRLPGLSGQVVTDVLPDGNGWWVATAKAGVVRVEGGTARPLPLRDPWVTALGWCGGVPLAGTSNGGLVDLWRLADAGPSADTRSRHVTGLSGDWAATRGGLYRHSGGWARVDLPDS